MKLISLALLRSLYVCVHMYICSNWNLYIFLIDIYMYIHSSRTGMLHIYKIANLAKRIYSHGTPNTLSFISNWQIHHKLNLLATSEFICRQSSVLFILTWNTPLLSFFSSEIRFKFPEDPHHTFTFAHFCSSLISSYFSSLLACRRHFRPGEIPNFSL